jgi:hypothetical protein
MRCIRMLLLVSPALTALCVGACLAGGEVEHAKLDVDRGVSWEAANQFK